MCSACGNKKNNDETTTTAQNNIAEATTKKTTTAAYSTFTGLKPLKEVTLKVSDPENTKGLSTKATEHSYGVSTNGKPHQISVDSQNYFDSKNFKAITYDKKSSSKVLYLTFDCGYENGNTEKILDVLKEEKVPAAFFCTKTDIESAPKIIARMIKEGHIVGNHSVTHPSFPSLSRAAMAKEIQGCDNYLRTNFGYTSKYFRFPKGEYSDCALDLVGSVGYTSVFWSLSYADWDTDNQKGADYAFNTVTARLHPGAIILLHAVSSDNAGAMKRIIEYAKKQGYSFKSLDEFSKC